MTSIFDTSSVQLDAGVGTPTISPTLLSWSDPDGATSSLTVATSSQLATTDAGTGRTSVPAFTLTHINSSVDYERTPTLRAGAVLARVELHDGGELATSDFNLAFRFLETVNKGVDGVCHDGNAPPIGGCADLFVADVAALEDSFTQGGQRYETSLSPVNSELLPLTAGECLAVGASDGCVGFVTVERGTTDIDFAFEIDAVPLPPALLLLPSALLGMALLRRRAML